MNQLLIVTTILPLLGSALIGSVSLALSSVVMHASGRLFLEQVTGGEE